MVKYLGERRITIGGRSEKPAQSPGEQIVKAVVKVQRFEAVLLQSEWTAAMQEMTKVSTESLQMLFPMLGGEFKT